MGYLIGFEQSQDDAFRFLCAAYAIVSSAALILLIRAHLRDLERGFTTQKLFYLMILIVNGARTATLGFRKQVFSFRPKEFASVLLDLPGILFFSTYMLLVLYWAEIYYQEIQNQAKHFQAEMLRIHFFVVNAGIYVTQISLWIYLCLNDNPVVETIGKIFPAVVSFVGALGFFIYGGRLCYLLWQFPVNSKGRKKKLDQIGFITAICITSFLIKSSLEGLSAVEAEASAKVPHHPALSFIYMVSEVLTSALVLYILRKLPPKKVSEHNHHSD